MTSFQEGFWPPKCVGQRAGTGKSITTISLRLALPDEGRPSLGSAPHRPHCTVFHRISSYSRVGSTFRDVCAHGRAVGVSTRRLRNSLFPLIGVFVTGIWQPSLESARCLHCTSYKFALALDQLFVTFARMVEPLVCLLGGSATHFFPTGFHGQPTESYRCKG